VTFFSPEYGMADETMQLIAFQKMLNNHQLRFPGMYSMIDGMFLLDEASVNKLREEVERQGIKSCPDGLLQVQIKGWLYLQISNTVWVRMIVNPRLLQGYRLEAALQKFGLGLKAVLKIHDQLEPPPKPTTCPRCGTSFLDDQEVNPVISSRNPWPSYGGHSQADSRWPAYG
jgi:hypothetical protein